MSMIEKLRAYMDSPEGQAEMEKDAQDLIAKRKIEDSQLSRFHIQYSHRFEELIEKIQAKYDTEEYVTRWMKRSREPQEELLWFLKEYASEYGREATNDEFEKYGNMFTSELYYVKGYFFNLMMGQGAALKISKEVK